MSYSYNHFASSEFEYSAASAEVQAEISKLPEDQQPSREQTARSIFLRRDARMAKLAQAEQEAGRKSIGMNS